MPPGFSQANIPISLIKQNLHYTINAWEKVLSAAKKPNVLTLTLPNVLVTLPSSIQNLSEKLITLEGHAFL